MPRGKIKGTRPSRAEWPGFGHKAEVISLPPYSIFAQIHAVSKMVIPTAGKRGIVCYWYWRIFVLNHQSSALHYYILKISFTQLLVGQNKAWFLIYMYYNAACQHGFKNCHFVDCCTMYPSRVSKSSLVFANLVQYSSLGAKIISKNLGSVVTSPPTWLTSRLFIYDSWHSCSPVDSCSLRTATCIHKNKYIL